MKKLLLAFALFVAHLVQMNPQTQLLNGKAILGLKGE